jgi:Ca2+-binding RTX toxin-like protein
MCWWRWLGNDSVNGGTGNDTLDGGDGIDTVDYATSASGVAVDLGSGSATSASDGIDSISLMENVVGSGLADTINGDINANVIESGAGNDTVNAGDGTDLIVGGSGQGNDTYDGGVGIDTLRYTSATFGVVVNLKLGTATDSAAGKAQANAALRIDNDLISNVENIETGTGSDDVTGDSRDNLFLDKGESDTDTVRLSGAFSDYTVSLRDVNNPSLGIVIRDNVANRDGVDTFVNYERFIFGSTTYIWNPTTARLELADSTPPTITGISVSGNQVLLQFSEALNTTNLPATARFTVRVANVVRNVTGLAAVAGDPTQLRLTIAVTPTSSQTVNVAYNDFTTGNDATGVVQDLAGNDMGTTPTPINATTFSSSTTVTTLAANYTNLILTGTSAISGTGNALANNITGNSAVNVITGAAGIDAMDGGGSGDIYLIASSADHSTAEITDTGTTGVDELRFAATTANQTLSVFAGDTGLERVIIGAGTAAAATSTATTALSINASAAPNALTLSGNYGVNSLTGTAFNDLINGNRGNDILTGGLGADTFRFDSTLNATTNKDTITDFTVDQADKIQLENAIFTALTTTGVLNANAFVIGNATTTAAQRIIYNSTTGTLTYDSNGSGAGGATVIAQMSGGLALTAGMFNVT